MTAKVVVAAMGFTMGILAAAYLPVAAWLAGVAAMLAGAVADRPRRALWLALALGFAPGAARFDFVARSRTQGELAESVAESKVMAIRGRVTEEPDVKSDRAVALSVRVEEVRCGTGEWHRVEAQRCSAILLAGRGTNVPPVRVRIPELCRPAAYGYEVQIAGLRSAAKLPSSRRSGDPVVLLAHWAGARIVQRHEGATLMEFALRMKEALLAAFAEAMDERSAKLAAGMTLGDKAAVYSTGFHGTGMRDLFARAGIAHLLAVSGSNVSVLTVVVCALLTRLGLSRRATLAPALAVVLIYTLMTGMSASAERAGIMNAVGLFVWALGPRKFSAAVWLGMAISAFAILGSDPEELFRPGFQLSFLAVATLVLGTWRVDRVIENGPGRFIRWSRWPKSVRLFLAAQFAIQLGLNIPMSAVYFGHYSVAGLVVNLAAIPIAAILTPGSLLVGLLELLPAVGHWLALPFAWCVEALSWMLLEVAAICANIFPYPEMAPWPKAVVGGYYAVMVGILYLTRRTGNSSSEESEAGGYFARR